jgi:2-oxo-4-hydroxy-4-carboxy-5-ureidoimidazoline decarboxylase
MSKILVRWNGLEAGQAAKEILPCCGSQAWARAVAARRPLQDEPSLVQCSDEIWKSLPLEDWLEAFSTHPRIGERKAPPPASSQSAAWSQLEQKNVADAGQQVQSALADGNREYERRFGRVFLVCATGKSAPEILAILERRLQNDAATELREAAEEQRKITNLRLKKWLSQ